MVQTRNNAAPKLRTPFTTSRLLEFCTIPDLIKQVGVGTRYWPGFVVKELGDNAFDICEEISVAPEIAIAISTKDGTITVADNGPGIAPETVTRLIDFHTKTSSREAYVGPTRGQQGNALQAIIAMPFALDGSRGETTIEAHGVAHRIVFTIDPIRREPRIEHIQETSLVQSGTSITMHWPVSARSQLVDAKGTIVQVALGFSWLVPNARIALKIDDQQYGAMAATDPTWRKWRASDPAPAAWYDRESLSRLIAAVIADDQDHGRNRTVREFLSEFRGLARSDVQKQVLDEIGAARMSLPDFFMDPARVPLLLATMQRATKPVAAKDLGLLGKEHFAARFRENGVEPETFQYRRALREVEGVPYVLEAAFGYVPELQQQIRLTGINWSPSPGPHNPFRTLGGRVGTEDSLDALLVDQFAGWNAPVIFALHLAGPRLTFTDKAKTALALPDDVTADLVNIVNSVTGKWAKVRKAEERDAALAARRMERLTKSRRVSIKDVAYDVMEQAYLKAGDNGELPAEARQIMYAARPEIQERTGRQLDDQYFTQTLLPDYLAEHEDETADWDVVFDDRGHLTEPHTGYTIGLGTLSVREYLAESNFAIEDATLTGARVITRGPEGCFGGVLFVEKEGFLPLFDRVQLGQRYDLAIMSTKGLSVTAARRLVDKMCAKHGIPLFVLHDFDKSGFSIIGTFKRATRRYEFENKIEVIDLGLRLSDVSGLQREQAFDRGSETKRRVNLRRNGATSEEIEFLLRERVELNALTARQLVDFVERKLKQHRVKKIIPAKPHLVETYRALIRGREVEKIVRRELRKLNGAAQVSVPHDLDARVQKYLRKRPAARWDEAVAAIARGAK
jgi:DNA topoisomerase VI subunit B